MFGFGGGFNGPGGGSTNSGSAPSGGAGGKAAEKGGRVGSSTSNAGREGTTSGPGNPGHTASTSSKNGNSSSGKGFGAGFNGPGGSSTNSGSTPSSKSSGAGSMERGRSVDRAGVTGYAGNSKTHEQDIADRHAERESFVDRALAAGGHLSTNVEGMTAQDFADQRARQVGGLIAQTNTALRSNDLMSPFSLASTYDTRYGPNIQAPVASSRQYEISPTALAAGGAKPVDRTADLGRYRTVDAFAYGPSTFTDIKNELSVEAANKGAAPGLSAANFASRYLGASANDGMSPSERNAQGKEGTTSGPGNPGASGSAPGKSGRVGVGSFDGRSLPSGFDTARFGDAISTPKGDRVTRGFGAAIPDRTFRDAEEDSMASLNSFRSTDLAEERRAQEDASMDRYSTAAANTAVNALRADAATAARAQENQSVTDLENRRAALRNTIAGTESPDYNTIYGGTKFTSYDDHPRQYVTITSGPNKGRKSSAAGKYQMLASTWDRVATKLGLPDFSPKNQDIAADYLANEAYNKSKNGKHASLDAALAAGDIKGISKALAGTWTSLPGGIEQTTTTGRFAGQYDQHLADLGAPTNVTDHPITNDFASTYLGKDTKQAQVDYFGSVPQKGGYAAANEKALKDQESVRTASAEEGDTSPQSASYTPDASLTEFPDRPRSNFEKVAAAGLDIGAGLIPGVGLGVGLVNGALSLTGNRTIGERLVDAIATGKGGKNVPNNGDPEREYQVADSTVPAAASHKTVPTVQDFTASYLSPPDKTKYPTPYERYDLNRNTYAGV